MYQAIQTKFLGPTNTRGARVKATADAGSITVQWDHRLNIQDNHRAAAVALARKFGWGDPKPAAALRAEAIGLLAAQPATADLLAALRDLLTALERDLPQVAAISTGPVAAARAARAAIAKAGG